MKKNKYRKAPPGRKKRGVHLSLTRLSIKRRKIRRGVNRTSKNFAKTRGKFSLKRTMNRIIKLFIGLFKFPTIPKLLLFITICSAVYLTYKIDQINYFGIKKIQLSGNKQISVKAIEEKCSGNLNKNIFTLSVDKLENDLREMSVFVKKTHVEKLLPDTLAVNIEEREPLAVWRTVNGAYLIDNEGYILEKAINENINLEVIQNNLLLENTDEENADNQPEIDEENIGQEQERNEAEDQDSTINLDEDLEKQIDWELKQREKEINLFEINFDDYLQLPDTFKKYPQVKVWSDQIFEVGTYTETEILNKYLTLNVELNSYSFEAVETLVFSESKALVNFKEGFKVYFKLNTDIPSQIKILNFIYSKLQMEGITFKEIDLRFKRPVIRE